MSSDRDYYANFQVNQDLPRLHFYTWSQPTLSLGRYQKISPELEQRAQKLKIPLVRRPTGGQGILHSQDITWSLCGSLNETSVLASYQKWANLHIKALRQLGIQAEMGQESRAYRQESSCFQVLNAGDIYVLHQQNKGKFIGAAQLRRRGAFLQQQLLYLDLPTQLFEALFGKVPRMYALNQLPDSVDNHFVAQTKHLNPAIIQATQTLLPDSLRGQQVIYALILAYRDFFQSEPEFNL